MNIFIFYIILLLFIISNVNSNNVLSLFKRDDSISTEYSSNKECLEERRNSKYFYKCIIPDINLSNYKEICLNITSEICQSFYNDSNPLQYFPICSPFAEFNQLFKPGIFQYIVNDFNSYCQTDENGETCPLSLFKLTLTDETTSSSTLLNDTCHSKKCTDSYIEYLKIKLLYRDDFIKNSNNQYSYDQLIAPKKVISQLESAECKSAHTTSDAITTKINQFLLITLSLLLLSVFIY